MMAWQWFVLGAMAMLTPSLVVLALLLRTAGDGKPKR
jgi:hypothetical protein